MDRGGLEGWLAKRSLSIVDVESQSEVGKALLPLLRHYADVEFLMYAPKDIKALRKESARLRDSSLDLKKSLKRMQRAIAGCRIPMVRGTLENALIDLEEAASRHGAAADALSRSILVYQKYSGSLKKKPAICRSFSEFSRSPRKGSSAVGSLVSRLSKEVGSIRVLFEIFQRYPILAPVELGKNYTEASLRKRIERFDRKVSTQK